MKCEAAAMRRSASSWSAASPVSRPSASRAKTSTGASSSLARGVEQRLQARLRSRVSLGGVERREQAVPEPFLLAAAGAAVELRRPLERGARLRRAVERSQHAPEVDPPERRQPDIAGGLGLGDRALQRLRTGLVVAGLALRTAEARDLVGLGLPEPEAAGGRRGAGDVVDGVLEAMLDARELAEHRVAPDVQPRVVDGSEPVLDLVAGVGGAIGVAGRDRCARGEERVRRLVPRPVEPVVERTGAGGQLQRLLPVAVMGDDVGEVVRAAALEVRVVRQGSGVGDVAPGRLEIPR